MFEKGFLQDVRHNLWEQFSKHTLALDRKDKKMAINPMKLLELKNLWNAFTRRHPKFPQFISAVQQAGISEGTVIEIQITTLVYPKVIEKHQVSISPFSSSSVFAVSRICWNINN